LERKSFGTRKEILRPFVARKATSFFKGGLFFLNEMFIQRPPLKKEVASLINEVGGFIFLH
jgi:hypothetical protein